jgi:hypothetical protein
MSCRRSRSQSSVVGVALLLGATVVALGVLTASVGALVDAHVARSDAARVASDLDGSIRPVETTGRHSGTVRFVDGSLRTAQRDLRVFDDDGLVDRFPAGALVFEHGERRAAFVAGAVLRGSDESAWRIGDPPVTSGPDVLVIGVPILGDERVTVGGSEVTVGVETNVSHRRRRLPPGRYRVAVETAAPAALEPYFEAEGASVTRRDFDGDGVSSVVAAYPGNRTAFLVEHRLRLEVSDG